MSSYAAVYNRWTRLDWINWITGLPLKLKISVLYNGILVPIYLLTYVRYDHYA